MKTLLLDVYNDRLEEIDIEDKLEEFYKALDCRTIEIPERKIAGKYFDIMCDEEGLFRDDAKISAISSNGMMMLVGNLMFFHHTEDGDLTGLSTGDINHIKRNILTVYTERHPEGYVVLTNCDF